MKKHFSSYRVWHILFVSTILAISTFYISCRKPYLDKSAVQALSGTTTLSNSFSMEEIMSRLPQTVLYNLGDKAIFYINESKTLSNENGTTLYFPIDEKKTRFIYAVKNNNNEMKLYLRIIYEESGSYEAGNYQAVEEILDLQTYEVYPQIFARNKLSAIKAPIKIAEPYWETCMIENGLFTFDNDFQILPDSIKLRTLVGKPNKYGCIENQHGTGESLIKRLGDWLGNIFNSGDGDYGNGSSPLPWYPGGGNWTNPNPGGGGSSGGGGNSGIGSPNLNNPAFNHPRTAPGFENGGNFNPEPYLATTSQLEVATYRDSNGFITTRKTALDIYLQGKPYGAIDCSQLMLFPNIFNLIQQVGSFNPPQSILDEISMIINNNTPEYNTNNTFIQKTEDGKGIVNMDAFIVKIPQLPNNSSNTTMTPLEFLEHFRKNLTSIFNTGGNQTTFSPFVHINPTLGININHTTRFNQQDINALGSWGSFYIPLIPNWLSWATGIDARNNGTIIMTEYHKDPANQTYWFTFTTMSTKKDGDHPVAGNRRFGILPSNDGGFTFFISGVDRVWGSFGSTVNDNTNAAFGGADQLWMNIQNNIYDYVWQNGGEAQFLNPKSYRARVDWDTVKEFLRGDIDLLTLKARLGCQ